MTLLATLYLLPEMIFNAELVRTAGSADSGYDEIRRLELFGRAVSGIGVSLLLLDALRILPLRSKAKTLFIAALIVVLIWPIVFFGQKILIDRFIIDSSSAEERQTAFLSILVKNGLAAKAVEVDGLPFDSDNPDSPVSQTFLTIFGGLVYANNDVLEQIKQSKEDIATAYVVNHNRAMVGQYLARHRELASKLRTAYEERYQPAYNRYKQAISDSGTIANDEWERVDETLAKGWADYLELAQSADELASRQAQQAYPKIYRFLDYYHSRCVNRGRINQRCRNRAEDSYNKQITQLGYGHIPHEYWLIVEDVSTGENLFGSLVAGILTGGASLALQTIDAATGGDGGFKDKRYSYTNDERHYRARIFQLPAFKQQFIDEYGYPPDLRGKNEFLAHPETAALIIERLAESGIELPSNWEVSDRQRFNDAVVNKITREAMQGWSNVLKTTSIDLPPGLTWNEFHQHKGVLAYINRQLNGIQLSRYNPDWSEEEFTRNVLEPEVQKKVDALLEQLAADQHQFADGGSLESQGKQSLRAVIVPPISMALSLFLVCLTVVKLPLRYMQLMVINPGKPLRLLFRVVPLVTLVAVVAAPFYFLQPNFDDEYPGATHFLSAVEATSNPAISGALEWTLKTQPVISPLGIRLSEGVKFDKNSEALIEKLEQLESYASHY